MKKELYVFSIYGDKFLLSSIQLSRQQKISIESLVCGAMEDYKEELYDKSNFEIINWIIDKAKEEGIDFEIVRVAYEFKMN